MTELANYVHYGDAPATGLPKTPILAAGNPVRSTTGSVTQLRWAKVAGARQRFKTIEELQSSAFECAIALRECQDSGQDASLRAKFSAYTGQEFDVATIHSPEEITVRQEFLDVAGKEFVYPGQTSDLCTQHNIPKRL